MKKLLSIFSLLLMVISCFGQDCTEYEQHLNSIKNTVVPDYARDRDDQNYNANVAFIEYTEKHLLEKPSDKCFIANRKLLRKLNVDSCIDTCVVMLDTLSGGEACKITIQLKEFNPKNHVIDANEDVTHIKTIDNQHPYGAQYHLPDFKLDKLSITINGRQLLIPKTAIDCFFDVNTCYSGMFSKPVEVYESISGEYLYLYLFGGNAAETYMAKLVFDKNNYLTTIVSDYGSLSRHAAFREDFIGF